MTDLGREDTQVMPGPFNSSQCILSVLPIYLVARMRGSRIKLAHTILNATENLGSWNGRKILKEVELYVGDWLGNTKKIVVGIRFHCSPVCALRLCNGGHVVGLPNTEITELHTTAQIKV